MISSRMMCLSLNVRRKRIMKRFLRRHKDRIVGTITGFDRVLLRGTLRSISHCQGLDIFLSSQHVLLKNFAAFAQQMAREISEHAETFAADRGRPYQYLKSSSADKEQLARELIEQDKLREGLVCVLAAVEPCYTLTVRGDRQTKQLRLRAEERQCKHLYFYFLNPEFGLMHIRLQTWFPFTLQVCINGRRWLANKLKRAGIAFVQYDNTFTEIADLARAQQFLDQLSKRKWPRLLNALTKDISPLSRHPEWKLHDYYWS